MHCSGGLYGRTPGRGVPCHSAGLYMFVLLRMRVIGLLIKHRHSACPIIYRWSSGKLC